MTEFYRDKLVLKQKHSEFKNMNISRYAFKEPYFIEELQNIFNIDL